MPPLALLTASFIVMCGGITTAQAAPVGPLATARLIAAAKPQDGAWTIGVVITLAPKAITYWRDPGEAGVPPKFDFAGSANVARATVHFPAPKRIREGDIDAIGYDGEVVIPITITPGDVAKPSAVHVVIDYATCERICLPAHADLTLDLPPPSAVVDGARVDAANARVPRILDAEGAKAIADVVSVTDGARPGWRVRPLAGGDGDLFAEAPEGFFLSTKRVGDAFLVSLDEHPAERPKPDFVRFTLVGRSGNVEFLAPNL